jgi:hypothetical protein
MKKLLLAGLLISSFASCKKESTDLTPNSLPAPAPAPVTLQAFTATTGSFAIDTRVAPPIALDNLQLQIVSQDDNNHNVTFAYTWRGHMPTSFYTIAGQLPAGTGIEVRATFTVSKLTPLGKGPWYTNVSTYTTDPNFSNPKALDLAGNGLLTQTSTGYKLPFTAQFIDGSLIQ